MHIPSIVYRSTPQTDWPIVAAENRFGTGSRFRSAPWDRCSWASWGTREGGGRRSSNSSSSCPAACAVHRVNEQGIPASFTRVPAASFAKRRFLAFACSHLLGLNIAPLSFRARSYRVRPRNLTAIPVAEPFLRVDILSPERRTVAPSAIPSSRSLGRGARLRGPYRFRQRFETSAVCDGAGYVRTTLHHEALQYGDRDASARIAAALRAGPGSGPWGPGCPLRLRSVNGAGSGRHPYPKVRLAARTLGNGGQRLPGAVGSAAASRPTCLDVSLMVIWGSAPEGRFLFGGIDGGRRCRTLSQVVQNGGPMSEMHVGSGAYARLYVEDWSDSLPEPAKMVAVVCMLDDGAVGSRLLLGRSHRRSAFARRRLRNLCGRFGKAGSSLWGSVHPGLPCRFCRQHGPRRPYARGVGAA